MSKIFNWFFGSFFRTLGRVLVFMLLGYILFNFINISDLKLPNLFGVLNVNADSISVSDASNGYVLINDNNFNYQDFYNRANEDVAIRFSLNVPLSYTNIYSYAFIDICSAYDIWSYRSSGLGQSCGNSCFSNQTLTTKTNYICTTGDYQGKIYRVSVPISKWGRDTADELGNVSDKLSIGTGNSSWNPMRVYGVYLTDTSETGQYQVDYSNAINDINSSINGVNSSINNVNSSINDLNSSINDSSSPNLDGLNNSAGWLPAGAIDGILNLPLTFLNSLTTNLSKTCNPVELPLPFVDKTLTLPCVNSLYSQINGLNVWINSISVIASAFILFRYLINLYKWVDDTLTFRENNFIDNWSGV